MVGSLIEWWLGNNWGWLLVGFYEWLNVLFLVDYRWFFWFILCFCGLCYISWFRYLDFLSGNWWINLLFVCWLL